MKKLLYLSLLAVLCLSSLATAQEDKKKKIWGEATLMALTSTSTFGTFTNTQYMMSAYYATNLLPPADAKGTLTVPETLGIGPVIPLNIRTLKDWKAPKRLYYWGCSATVLKDQPEVRAEGWRMKEQWWVVNSNGTADATKMMGLNAQSKVPGKYVMETSYTGSMSLVMTDTQQFLPPLKVVEPASDKVDTSQAIPVKWEKVPGAGGYLVMASGKNAKGEDVTWESAYNAVIWQRMGVAKALKKGLLKGPDHLQCTIPAGIFKGQVSIIVTAVTPIATGEGAFSFWGWAQSMGTKIVNMGG